MSGEPDFIAEYIRRGRALNAGESREAGYPLPAELEARVRRELCARSSLRRVCHVVRTGTSGYLKLVETDGAASGWLTEEPGSGVPAFAEIATPSGDLFAIPAA